MFYMDFIFKNKNINNDFLSFYYNKYLNCKYDSELNVAYGTYDGINVLFIPSCVDILETKETNNRFNIYTHIVKEKFMKYVGYYIVQISLPAGENVNFHSRGFIRADGSIGAAEDVLDSRGNKTTWYWILRNIRNNINSEETKFKNYFNYRYRGTNIKDVVNLYREIKEEI